MTESIQGIVIPPKVSRTTLGMILFHLSKTMAMIGGLLFILLIVMSCYSLIERKFGGTGVIGDIEMMQMGCAVASSLFLPFFNNLTNFGIKTAVKDDAIIVTGISLDAFV